MIAQAIRQAFDPAAFLDRDGNEVATDFCQVRGAWSAEAFADQKEKIVSAINTMDADVLALMEIENSAAITYLAGQPRDKALAKIREMLKGLQEHTGKKPIIYTDITFHEDVLEGQFNDHPYWLRSTASRGGR